MKKGLSFCAALLCSIALFTSCLGDNDSDNTTEGLTKEQIHTCYLKMAGEHKGKMLYQRYEDETCQRFCHYRA